MLLCLASNPKAQAQVYFIFLMFRGVNDMLFLLKNDLLSIAANDALS